MDSKIPDVTIVRIPKFKAVTSGLASTDEVFGAFGAWQESRQHLFQSHIFDSFDFLMGIDGKFEWIFGVKDEVSSVDVTPYNLIEFEGGLYAVAVSVDGDSESHNKVRAKVAKWLEATNFIEDTNRLQAGNIIYPDDEIKKGLGYNQMNLYLPIKLKNRW